MSHIPALPHGCNSWVVVHKGTLNVIIELYHRPYVELFNPDKVDVLTAIDYLERLNASIKKS